tara:strand:+ start:505 stop:726 length:222 start_codon:yes stop_codon:yes gene_type:complete
MNANNSNFDEYQKNVDQYKQEQSQNSKRNSRWKNNSNVYNGGMGDNSNSTINDLSSRINSNNPQKHHSKQQKS